MIRPSTGLAGARPRLLVLLGMLVVLGACGSNPVPQPSGSASLTPASTAAVASQATPGSTAPPEVSSEPRATAAPTPGASTAGGGIQVLPTPTTTDVVLLVGSPASLTDHEQQWLSDLRAQLGNVDTLAYADVTLDALRAYFVVFVIDQSPDLDVAALASAFRAGLTIHLVGPAAAYQSQVTASAP
jgi:hypothetical protein